MEPNTNRLFLGIPISKAFTTDVLDLVNLQPNEPGIRWTPLENLHVTLVFKGNTPSFLIPELKEKLRMYFNGKPKFELLFDQFCLTPKRNPRMVWAQFQLDPLFKLLVVGVSDILKTTHDRTPIPHITIARFKSDANYEALNLDILPKTKSISVNEINLYQSVLKPDGAIYNILDTYTL